MQFFEIIQQYLHQLIICLYEDEIIDIFLINRKFESFKLLYINSVLCVKRNMSHILVILWFSRSDFSCYLISFHTYMSRKVSSVARLVESHMSCQNNFWVDNVWYLHQHVHLELHVLRKIHIIIKIKTFSTRRIELIRMTW